MFNTSLFGATQEQVITTIETTVPRPYFVNRVSENSSICVSADHLISHVDYWTIYRNNGLTFVEEFVTNVEELDTNNKSPLVSSDGNCVSFVGEDLSCYRNDTSSWVKHSLDFTFTPHSSSTYTKTVQLLSGDGSKIVVIAETSSEEQAVAYVYNWNGSTYVRDDDFFHGYDKVTYPTWNPTFNPRIYPMSISNNGKFLYSMIRSPITSYPVTYLKIYDYINKNEVYTTNVGDADSMEGYVLSEDGTLLCLYKNGDTNSTLYKFNGSSFVSYNSTVPPIYTNGDPISTPSPFDPKIIINGTDLLLVIITTSLISGDDYNYIITVYDLTNLIDAVLVETINSSASATHFQYNYNTKTVYYEIANLMTFDEIGII